MNQQKECFEFIDAKIPKDIGSSIKDLLNKIEEKSCGKYWEAPAVAKFPEDSDEAKWHLWWTDAHRNNHISLDWYAPNDLYVFYRNRKTQYSIGEECTVDTFSDDFVAKILNIKYAKDTGEDE